MSGYSPDFSPSHAPQTATAATPAHGSALRLGVVSLDADARKNATCRLHVAPEQARHYRRDVYVGIHDPEQGLEFLGRTIAGPFHTAGESASEAGGGVPYEVYGTVEILGQLTEGERALPTATRPRPGATVYVFPDDRLRAFLEINGDFQLGHLVGHTNVAVHAPSDNKNFLPRNVGVFGTVGSGKSNTAQVLAEEAVAAGWAVVLIDVEGEYVRMNEPTDDARLVQLLDEEYGLGPKGIDDFHVYVPSSGKSEAAAPLPFKIPISALAPEVVADILEFTDAEARVFATVAEQATLQYSGSTNGPGGPPRPFSLQHLIDGLVEGPVFEGRPTIRLLPLGKVHDVSTAGVLRAKLMHLATSGMLDWNATVSVPELPVQELLVGGRLSVLDVSETDDRSRNLAIAFVLQSLFEQVIATPIGTPLPSGRPRPPLLVIVEEVHTFVSRAAAPKMRAVLDSLQVISRRGRKRWMALSLVSQQPNHVPDEIFELANTRFIHQLKSTANLLPVKQTTGNIDESLWENVSSMGPGQCLVTGAVFRNPLFLGVRPARSRRLLVT